MNVILYHQNCNDGLFAAYACWLKFQDKALYIPVNYKPIQDMTTQESLDHIFNYDNNSKIKETDNSIYQLTDIAPEKYKDINLYVVDYSFPVNQFKDHCNLFKSVTVLDHHDSAIKAYCGEFVYEFSNCRKKISFGSNHTVIFSEKESGAKLTFNYLFPEERIPEYFELVSDRDLWSFKLNYTKAFHSGTRLLNFVNFRKLDLNLKYGLNRILDLGMVYESELANRIKKVKRSGVIEFSCYIDGRSYRLALVNSYLDIASDLCSSILSDGYEIAMAYYIGSDDVSISVRSLKDIDSSVISKHFGGGGHQQASGFQMPLTEFTNLLNTKRLEVKTNG